MPCLSHRFITGEVSVISVPSREKQTVHVAGSGVVAGKGACENFEQTAERFCVVRVSAYPHRVAETAAWERAAIESEGARYEFVDGWDDPAARELLRNADAVLCTYEPIGEERLDMLQRCRLIVMGSVGLDGVDIDGARARGITICNMPDICVDEVAEHTLALLLGSVRKLALLDREVKSGLWQRSSLEPMPRIKGSRLGLIGAGRIGQAVAVRAAAFGMTVVAYDPFLKSGSADTPLELVSLHEVCSTSDFVSIHVPATPQTRHLIDEPELRSMKQSCTVINTARGAVINETALVRALENGLIRGAALDVLETEPPALPHRLSAMDNVLLTPHTAGFSDDVVDTVPRLAVSAVMRLVKGDDVPERILVDDAAPSLSASRETP
jgi:D-3-phosphoglycerate dehydrogenase